MADTHFQVSAGTGTYVHTITRTVAAQTAHDEVMAIGLPFLPTYSTEDGGSMNTTTISKHLWQLMAGASLNIYVHRITLWAITLAGAATIVPFTLHRLTTAGSGGTAGTPGTPYDTSDGAVGATYMTMPSSLGAEGASLWQDRVVVPTAAPTFPGSVAVIDWKFDEMPHVKVPRIPAGTANGLALKNNAALATATYTGRIIFCEASY